MGSYFTSVRTLERKGPLSEIESDLLVVPVYLDNTKAAGDDKKDDEEDAQPKPNFKFPSCLQALDDAFGGALSRTLTEECFSANLGKFRVFKARQSDGIKARWLMILGVSPKAKAKVDAPRLDKVIDAYRKALASTYGFNGLSHATICLGDADGLAPFSVEQWVYAAVQGAFQSTYKTREAGEKKLHALKDLTILTPVAVDDSVAAQAVAVADAEGLVKDLANQPANLKMTQDLVDAANSIALLPGVSVEVISDAKVLAKTMPAFWAVGQAAEHVDPPRFIKVQYAHPEADKKAPLIALVGKGVMFDTGGVQVKPDAYMNDMKFDMTGAASVLGAVKALATMGFKGARVNAYVAATKNLTGETAYLPDAIIDSSAGKKIEVRHTDAEGRLTLADAVFKAVQDKPKEMITIATLTGAAVAAVGPCTALMGTSCSQKEALKTAFEQVGDAIQKLDFIEEDYENVQSDLDAADLRNTSKGKGRGHMTAGAFVVSFAEEVPIAHLDIAGGDAKEGKATGVAVKGLIQYVLNRASQL